MRNAEAVSRGGGETRLALTSNRALLQLRPRVCVALGPSRHPQLKPRLCVALDVRARQESTTKTMSLRGTGCTAPAGICE